MHDYDHYVRSDWSLEGEITAYKAAASRAPSLEIQKILYSNCPQSGCLYLSGTRSEPKTVFRNILQHRVRQAQMSRFSPPAYSVGLTSVHTAGMETGLLLHSHVPRHRSTFY